MYLLLFLRKFVVGELDPVKGINSRDRKTRDPGHTWPNPGKVRPEFLGWWGRVQKPRKTVEQPAGMTTRAGWKVLEEMSTGEKVELLDYLMEQSDERKKIWDLEKGVGRKIDDRYLETKQRKNEVICECRSEVKDGSRGWGLAKERISTPNTLSGSAVNTLCIVFT